MTLDPINKAEMLRQVRKGRAEFEALLAQFNEAQMRLSFPPDGWSVKDVMAHIAYWENYVLERFREASRGEKPRLLGVIAPAELDRINQEALEAGRARILAEVKDEFRRAHRELWTELEEMPENRKGSWWALWPNSDRPWTLIMNNTWEHYEEHSIPVREWVKSI